MYEEQFISKKKIWIDILIAIAIITITILWEIWLNKREANILKNLS